MKLGAMRHRLALQSRTETLDSFGDAVLSYTSIATVWGSLRAVSGRERYIAQQAQSEVSHEAIVRHTTDTESLTPEDRVTFDSRTFDVISNIDPDGRKRFRLITLLERL